MRWSAYLTLLALCLLVEGACKKNRAQLEEAAEKGKLRRVAENLEEAYASAPLPGVSEPVSFAERLEKWDDFRSCTVRTYVARKRDADRRQQKGIARRTRHASIGDETVEECAVQLAVAKKDTEICERLGVDYAGPNGETPLEAARCWDTRARIFGTPDECPVLDLGDERIGRNPECLALARRDQTLCPFTDSPGRCRALLTNDPSSCRGSDGAPDCELAFEYWQGLIPAGLGAPLFDAEVLRDKPPSATFDLRWSKNEHPHVRVDAPKHLLGVSWPAGKAKTPVIEREKLWGYAAPDGAVSLSWSGGSPAMKLVFQPGGADVAQGVRALQPPSPTAPATLIAIWPDDASGLLRCQPGPATTGDVRFIATGIQPGGFVDGRIKAEHLTCSDGSELAVEGTFRLAVLDLR